MILFKRVSESFTGIQGREWALLFLETIGVLGGILLAFELNEWSSSRSVGRKSHQMLERLFDESEADVASAREMRNVMRGLRDNEVAFSTSLSNGQCPAASRWSAINTISMLPSFDVPRTVYQEMMGSGGLSSIPDRRVREAVAQFNAQLEWANGQNDYFRSGRPEAISSGDRRVRLQLDRGADEPETAEYDRPALCADQSFRNRMIEATRNHMVVVGYHEGLTDWAINMCGILGASLGRPCLPPFGGPLTQQDAALLLKATSRMRP